MEMINCLYVDISGAKQIEIEASEEGIKKVLGNNVFFEDVPDQMDGLSYVIRPMSIYDDEALAVTQYEDPEDEPNVYRKGCEFILVKYGIDEAGNRIFTSISDDLLKIYKHIYKCTNKCYPSNLIEFADRRGERYNMLQAEVDHLVNIIVNSEQVKKLVEKILEKNPSFNLYYDEDLLAGFNEVMGTNIDLHHNADYDELMKIIEETYKDLELFHTEQCITLKNMGLLRHPGDLIHPVFSAIQDKYGDPERKKRPTKDFEDSEFEDFDGIVLIDPDDIEFEDFNAFDDLDPIYWEIISDNDDSFDDEY